MQALVAGAFSVLVFVIGALFNGRLIQRERQRVMTTKLYERRIELYPELWAITGRLRWSRMVDDPATDTKLSETLASLSAWHERSGLFLSKLSYRALMELMAAIDACTREQIDEPVRKQMLRTIWQHKNTMRRVLRIDLGLLFREDTEEEPPRN